MSAFGVRLTALCGLVGGILLASCTAMLGDDFSIVPSGSGGAGQGGAGASTGGMTNEGGGGQGAASGGGAGATGGSEPCGNGEPDDGEICDGDCPTDCIDEDQCTESTMIGTAEECSAQCPHEVIDTCIDDDGCCPNGCYHEVDNDCYPTVAVVSAFANGIGALVSALQATERFGGVEPMLASDYTPTADNLAPFDVVVVANKYDAFDDPVALGDALADYYDQGGRVVVANGANCTPYGVAGRFVNDGYLVFEPGALYPGDDPLGAIEVPTTPLMTGSEGFVAYGHCDPAPASDAVVVARYQVSGAPVVAYRMVQDRWRADLNLYPPPDSGAEGVALLVNAIFFQ